MTIPTIRTTWQRPSRDPNTNRRGVLGGIGLHSYHAGMRTTTATIALLACSAPLMGQGLFGAQQVISTNADGAFSVYAADVDGDGDIDVLSASFADDKIAWYENTDGQGSFGAQQVISTNADNCRDVFAADIDGDGDVDVLSASLADDKIAWYENTDGLGTFGAQQIISTNADGAWSVYAADVDGDGDIDVLLSLIHI